MHAPSSKTLAGTLLNDNWLATTGFSGRRPRPPPAALTPAGRPTALQNEVAPSRAAAAATARSPREQLDRFPTRHGPFFAVMVFLHSHAIFLVNGQGLIRSKAKRGDAGQFNNQLVPFRAYTGGSPARIFSVPPPQPAALTPAGTLARFLVACHDALPPEILRHILLLRVAMPHNYHLRSRRHGCSGSGSGSGSRSSPGTGLSACSR